MDEAYDMWADEQKEGDNHLWFADWWQRDIADMVLRDRNHPCVISYSVGNEILESRGDGDGAKWSEKLAAEVRKYDNTRLVTAATWETDIAPDKDAPEEYIKEYLAALPQATPMDKKGWGARTEAYYAPFDICGYNYMYHRYESDRELFPNRVIWGSETRALEFYDSWQKTVENSHVIGDFTWTAYDNLGEAGTGRFAWKKEGTVYAGATLTGYPWRTCFQGDFDLAGFRRPQSYFREAIWGNSSNPKIFTTHPSHYGDELTGTGWHWHDVKDTWNYPDEYIGKPVCCEVYTTADRVEWYLNGEFLGESKPEKAIARFDVPYQKGELSVKTFEKDKVLGQSRLITVGEAKGFSVEMENIGVLSDSRGLCYIDITVTDQNGRRIADAENEIFCDVAGGELLCVFSGAPANEDEYGSNCCHVFGGRAVAVVKVQDDTDVVVTVKSEGLKSCEYTIRREALV